MFDCIVDVFFKVMVVFGFWDGFNVFYQWLYSDLGLIFVIFFLVIVIGQNFGGFEF